MFKTSLFNSFSVNYIFTPVILDRQIISPTTSFTNLGFIFDSMYVDLLILMYTK